MNDQFKEWPRRRIMFALGACALGGMMPGMGHATEDAGYPVRAVKLQVGFVAGGAIDAIARDLAKNLAERWKQSVVVENKGGASGTIAAAVTAHATPDGYTLLLTSDSALVSAPFINDQLPYDPLEDLKPICLVSGFPLVLVAHVGLKLRSLSDLISLARSKPGAIAYASTGIGTSSHLPMELFQQLASIKLNHIPYKGGGQATNDVVAGTVPLMLTTYALAAPHIQAGKLTAVAVGSPHRIAQLPSVATFAEQGFATVEAANWVGVVGPKGLSDALVRKIGSDLGEIVATQAYRDRMNTLGFEPRSSTPEEFGALIRKDYERNRGLLGKASAKGG